MDRFATPHAEGTGDAGWVDAEEKRPPFAVQAQNTAKVKVIEESDEGKDKLFGSAEALFQHFGVRQVDPGSTHVVQRRRKKFPSLTLSMWVCTRFRISVSWFRSHSSK